MTPEQTSKVATAEEAEGWITNFRQYCEAQRIVPSYDNKEFIALERAYWLGLMAGRGNESLPIDIQRILFAYKSPVLESKGAGKKRVRRTRAQIQSDLAKAVTPTVPV